MDALIFYSLFLLSLHGFRHWWGPKLIQGLLKRWLSGKNDFYKIQKKTVTDQQLVFEMTTVRQSQWIDLLILAIALLLIAVQWSQIYWQWTDHSFLYSIGSLALLFLLQDAYFYGTHRALHLPFLYKKFHCVHHRSLVPNVWSSFSVHPVEKFIELLFYPLVICAIPLHPLVLMAFLFMSTTINFLGHSGYELKWHPKVKTLPLLYGATTVFHDLHHRSPRYNFGLYFTYLDALFTTEHPNYKNEFHKEVKTGQQSSPMPYLEYE